ncbi:precorrin-8X methylmutase [Synechococcus elongatus IITB7]|uniref:precorrin-8X methylmutase n=1 Tax=Synechococcus elongatus TaxID=32046 RepID=UPI0030D038F3
MICTVLPWFRSFKTQNMFDYIRNGTDIYRKSFRIIREEASLSHLPEDLATVVVRLIHACGMTDIVQDFQASETALRSGRQALQSGATILCDSQMVANGITRKRLPAQNAVICTLNEPEVPAIAERIDNTRSAAALDLWRSQLNGSVVVIGNAPTALFRLLEMLDERSERPALILGFPVGFVGAIESKQALAEYSHGIPFMTLHGRRGGSAIAAAAVNAIAQESEL